MKASECPIKIVGRWTLYVERNHYRFMEARKVMNRCASILLRTPSLYAYKLEVSYLWNSFANGVEPQTIIFELKSLTKGIVPTNLISFIEKASQDYSKYTLTGSVYSPEVVKDDKVTGATNKKILSSWSDVVNFKSQCAKKEIAVQDKREPLRTEPIRETPPFLKSNLRNYQAQTSALFCTHKRPSGLMILPCGAGKTLIAINILLKTAKVAIVFCASKMSVKQWGDEFQKWVASYLHITQIQVVKSEQFDAVINISLSTDIKEQDNNNITIHFITYKQCIQLQELPADYFDTIIFDEVHLVPPKLEQIPCIYPYAQLIGMTATLTRKDKYLAQLHNLVGPKKLDFPWKELEANKAITTPTCIEVRVPVENELRIKIEKSTKAEARKLSSQNPFKHEIVEVLLRKHKNDQILIFAAYTDQLEYIEKEYNIPIITGKTPQKMREKLLEMFRSGTINRLGLSKIGYSAIDLPNANGAIQLSCNNSSRQEESQQVGRLMRPKPGKKSFFYSLVSEKTVEEKMAADRQHFLIEQGVTYTIIESEDISE